MNNIAVHLNRTVMVIVLFLFPVHSQLFATPFLFTVHCKLFATPLNIIKPDRSKFGNKPGSSKIAKLQVEYTDTPLGIDVIAPRFSWQMLAPSGRRGYRQTKYQLEVQDLTGRIVWKSMVTTSQSLAIVYGGSPLKPSSRYIWKVTVWDQTGGSSNNTSWFETGLMNSNRNLEAWDGANWIGGTTDDMVLYSRYLPLFNLSYTLNIFPGSERAAMILGANDSRLMDKNKNNFQIENKINTSYFKVELDVSGLSFIKGNAYLHIFRSGYTDTDNVNVPIKTFIINRVIINELNKNLPHKFLIHCEYGGLTFSIDGHSDFSVTFIEKPATAGPEGTTTATQMPRPAGNNLVTIDAIPSGSASQKPGASPFLTIQVKRGVRKARNAQVKRGDRPKTIIIPEAPQAVSVLAEAYVNLNPMGTGHDVITYGMLCDLGFSVNAGQNASITDLIVYNTRSPKTTVFHEELSNNTYTGIFANFIDKGASGLSISNGAYLLTGGQKGILAIADPSHNAMPMLRTKFSTTKQVASARIYVTARGIYELYLNGKRVGDDYYNPGLSQYDLTQFYQTYDVNDQIKPGENVLGAMLGEGWWSGLLSFGTNWNYFGDRQSLLAKLVITYTDGTKKIIKTNDHDWKYFNKGSVVYSSLLMGEAQDARREEVIKNWSLASFDDSQWKKVAIVNLEESAYNGQSPDVFGHKQSLSFDKLKLIGQIGKNAGIYKTLNATGMQEVRPGVYIYNLGQNIVGVPKITFATGYAGQKITLRFSEVLYPDLKQSGKNVGMIMTENYRAALSEDTYVMKDGFQIFQPHFTSHGFQYIEITGIDQPLPLEAVQGISISSIHNLTASYESSNKKVNQLWSNLVWSNVDNFLSIPTDCPQRNERMGWSGDISVFSRTSTYVSNADQFLSRHMLAMRDDQLVNGKFTDIAPVGGGFGGLLWGSAGLTVAWEAYQQYQDRGLLENHYAAMGRYMTYLKSTISKVTGLSSDNVLGDWLGLQNNQLGTDYLVTAYHVFDLGIMVQVAEVLHKPIDVAKYRKEYIARKAFFNKTFVNGNKKTLGLVGGNGVSLPQTTEKSKFKVADTQTSYAVGLALGVFDDRNIPFMIENLKATILRENIDDKGIVRPVNSLMTGFIGTAWISKALSDAGATDLAYQLLENEQFPSWLYPVNQGATTIWERLNGYTVENGFDGNNGMNSFNHYSFGAIGQWLMAYSIGIQRDKPGFQQFILQPEPDPTGKMVWAKGIYDSQYGPISSSWKLAKGSFFYKTSVPANTSATLFLPADNLKSIRENGKVVGSNGIKFIGFEKGKAVFELTAGDYNFSSVLLH